MYPELMKVVEYNLSNGNTKYKTAEDNLNKLFAPIADCPDLEELFKPKFEANPEDKELVDQIIGLLDKRTTLKVSFTSL